MVKYTSTITEIQSVAIDRVGFSYKIYSPSYHGFPFYNRIGEEITGVVLYGSLARVSFALLGRRAGEKGCIRYNNPTPFVGHCEGTVEIGSYGIGY